MSVLFSYSYELNYPEIKKIVIEWIDNNYQEWINLFEEEEKEEVAKYEFDYIKSKDSLGSHYTMSVTSIFLI